MDARFRIMLALLVVGTKATTLAQANFPKVDEIPIVTVCEALRDRILYNGKVIVITARFGSTDEGTWLTQTCEQKIITDGFTWDNIIWCSSFPFMTAPPPTLPQSFRWNDERIRASLAQVRKTTTLQTPSGTLTPTHGSPSLAGSRPVNRYGD